VGPARRKPRYRLERLPSDSTAGLDLPPSRDCFRVTYVGRDGGTSWDDWTAYTLEIVGCALVTDTHLMPVRRLRGGVDLEMARTAHATSPRGWQPEGEPIPTQPTVLGDIALPRLEVFRMSVAVEGVAARLEWRPDPAASDGVVTTRGGAPSRRGRTRLEAGRRLIDDVIRRGRPFEGGVYSSAAAFSAALDAAMRRTWRNSGHISKESVALHMEPPLRSASSIDDHLKRWGLPAWRHLKESFSADKRRTG